MKTNGAVLPLPRPTRELPDADLPEAVATPMRPDAFALTDGEKIATIAHHFEQEFARLHAATVPDA